MYLLLMESLYCTHPHRAKLPSSPVLCVKHWLFQGRRGHQAANKYMLTTGRNNYCPVLPPLRVRGTVPILAHSLLVLTVVIRPA